MSPFRGVGTASILNKTGAPTRNRTSIYGLQNRHNKPLYYRSEINQTTHLFSLKVKFWKFAVGSL